MHTTLAIKTYNENQLEVVEAFLKLKLKGLKVKTQVCGTLNNWVQVSISGEDEKIALRYISEEVGLCPNTIEEIRKFSTLKGYITAINKDQIIIDIGVSSPQKVEAELTLQHLQAQLADGRKLALAKLAELYGFRENIPLTVKALNMNKEEGIVETTFSEAQLRIYKGWMKSLLDRLIVLGATREKVMSVLRVKRCLRDVVDVESLGLFENAMVCKLGTDAAGLIPKIGRELSNAAITVFSPRRILEFFGENMLLEKWV
ncbi:MAG: DUF2110 family protein [Candidatus Bathyarchaeia archaeon]